MCGRAYSTYTDDEIRARYLNRRPVRNWGLVPHYNMSPTQTVPVLRELSPGERQLDLFRWQYVPAWEPEFKTRLTTINAKSETVFTSRTFKESILKKRCIVPVSGFFEWRANGEGGGKTPFRIWLKSEPIMSLAGVWTEWGPAEHRQGSFAILTTEANDFMKPIHTRMPVILDEKNEEAWLNPSTQDQAHIRPFLIPCANERLQAVAVSTLVNSPRNNMAQILDPVEAPLV